MARKRGAIAVTGLAACLAACGGSSNPAPVDGPDVTPPQNIGAPPVDLGWHAQGIWQGEISFDADPEAEQAYALIDEGGGVVLVTRTKRLRGALSLVDSDLPRLTVEATLTGTLVEGLNWPSANPVAEFAVEGTLLSRDQLDASFDGPDGSGSFNLPDYQRTTANARGTWVARDEQQATFATLNFNPAGYTLGGTIGDLYGSDVNGCIYSGTYEQGGWGSRLFYELVLGVENCPANQASDRNGTYFGQGAVVSEEPGSDEPDLFVISLRNDDRTINLFLGLP